MFPLVTPKVRKAEVLSGLMRDQILKPRQIHSRSVVSTSLGCFTPHLNVGLFQSVRCARIRPKSAPKHDLTETKFGSRFEKLPRVEAAPVGVVDVRVRPILENSTACTKSNAKNPGHYTVWCVFGIPLEID